jgi:hypothetical protein
MGLRTLKETDGIERLDITYAAPTGSVPGCALRRDNLASCLRGIRIMSLSPASAPPSATGPLTRR